jgi:hypothetical protein
MAAWLYGVRQLAGGPRDSSKQAAWHPGESLAPAMLESRKNASATFNLTPAIFQPSYFLSSRSPENSHLTANSPRAMQWAAPGE